MKNFFAFLVLLSLFSCRTIVVSSQYNREAPIDQYISFSWLPGIFEGNPAPALDAKALKNIQTQLVREMILKGFAYKDEGPQVLVNVEPITEEKRNLINVKKLGYDYWRGYDSLQTFKPGDLVVELVDASSNTVIWQGIAQNALNFNLKKEEEVGRVMKHVFDNLGY